MINAEQIRAGRAMLDWSTAELARRTGLTVNGINKIERGHVVAQRETLEKIQSAFEEAGLEFLPGSGLRKKDRIVTVFEGKAPRRDLLAEVYNALKDTGGEYLIAHEYEADLSVDMGLSYLRDSLFQRQQAKITHRLLVLEDDPGLFAPFDTYRVIDRKYFSHYPIHIYGSKIALTLRQYAPKAVIIDDARLADGARKLFNFVWDHAKEVPEAIQNSEQARAVYESVWGTPPPNHAQTGADACAFAPEAAATTKKKPS